MKAYHYIFSFLGARGVAEPELSHPLWNAYKRALKHTDASSRNIFPILLFLDSRYSTLISVVFFVAIVKKYSGDIHLTQI